MRLMNSFECYMRDQRLLSRQLSRSYLDEISRQLNEGVHVKYDSDMSPCVDLLIKDFVNISSNQLSGNTLVVFFFSVVVFNDYSSFCSSSHSPSAIFSSHALPQERCSERELESAPSEGCHRGKVRTLQVVMIGSEDQVQEFHNRAHHRSFACFVHTRFRLH